MNQNFGALVRLIDIVLTLLFGFIVVADLDPHKRIDLRRTSKTETTEKVEQRKFTFSVFGDGSYLVEESEGQDKRKLAGLPDVDTYLARNVAGDTTSVVFVKPVDGSTIQQSINVLDLCLKFDIDNATLDFGP